MSIDLEKLLAENPGVDLDRLREWREASRKLHPSGRNRYKYNLLSPFANRFRHRAVEDIAPEDNRKKQS